MRTNTAVTPPANLATGPAQATQLSVETIVERVRSGDLASFELIMRRYNQRLFRIARGIVDQDQEAEDVVQEAYVRAYERLEQFEGRARFATWLTKIVINEAITRRGRRQRLRLVGSVDSVEGAVKNEVPKFDPSQTASHSEIGRILAAEVDRLPSDFRTVFIMRAVEEMSTQETAECLDLSPSNVKVRFHRARAMLRERIDKRIGEDIRKLYQFDGERCDRIVATVLERLASQAEPK